MPELSIDNLDKIAKQKLEKAERGINYNVKKPTNYKAPDDDQKRKVWSTAVINKMIDDYNNGYEIDYSPFFWNDIELKAENISYDYTDEEIEEIDKCYNDPVYFIEKYCRFMTDKGYRPVKLRDFQKKLIRLVCSQEYNENLDILVPTNRNLIWCAARQSGKCYLYNTEIELSDGQMVKAGNIYDSHKNKLSIIGRIKKFLYKTYPQNKRIFKNLIGKTIELIEKYEYRNLKLDENDISKKIIETQSLNNFEVLSDTGYVPAAEIHKTQPYRVYELTLENGDRIECADNHIIYKVENAVLTESFVKDLTTEDYIYTKTGPSKVVSIYKCPYKLSMYDLSIDSSDHRYYTNNILSHNTTTMASIFAYLLTFSKDRNYMLLANKEQTVIEIADKIIQVFRGLPFFLKPGCKSFGKKGFKLDNNCRIITGATTKTTSIGFTVHLLYLDEFAHIDPNIVNSFWRSVYPTLSSSAVSQCMITSTPNGVDNKFYEIWSKSLNGENSFVNMRTDYWEVPEHGEAWVEEQKKNFGEEEFAQEFALQFNVASKMVLKGSDLAFLEKVSTPYVYKDLHINSPYLKNEKLKWHPLFDPTDISPSDRFVFVVDTADGGEDPDIVKKRTGSKDPDFNSIQIFKMVPNSISNLRKYKSEGVSAKNAVKFVQVGTFVDNETDEAYSANVAVSLALDLFKSHLYDNCRIMVEMNFNGKNFVTHCKKHNLFYDGLLQMTYHTKPIPGEKRKRKFGFKSGSEKNQYCQLGAKLISMRRLVPTDRQTYIQLGSFGYIKGKIRGIACHDDLSYPAIAFIPVMLNDETFMTWIEDFLYSLPDEKRKYEINKFIQQWDLENPEISDTEFNSMYGLNQQSGSFSPYEVINPYQSYPGSNNFKGFR